MPFVSLTLTDADRGHALAPELARAIAAALALTPSDVIVAVTGGARVSDGTGPVDGWPAAILHGSPRPPAAQQAALVAARAVLADALEVEADRVWVQWCPA